MTSIERSTRETTIRVELLDAGRDASISTSIPFLDHMLATLSRYAGIAMAIEASGDLRHHIIEDVAIALGMAIAARAPERAARYGDRTIPMDDALVHCALDLGGRPFYAAAAEPTVRSLDAIVRRQRARHASSSCAAWHRSPSRRRGGVQGARPRAARRARRRRLVVQHEGRRATGGRSRDADEARGRLPRCPGGRVVKGTQFVDLVDVGDPVALAERYERDGADEIVFLDIGATPAERATMLDVARSTADRLFIPLTIGGGIRSVDDVARALRSGADKVSVNSAAVTNPALISEAAARFGAQCVVASIDAKRVQRRPLGGIHEWRPSEHWSRRSAVGASSRCARRR